MQIDEKKLKFYVLLFDPNKKEPIMFNIFDNVVVKEEVIRALKKKINKEEFREILYKTCKYVFWSRCEYKMVVTGFPVNDKSEKVDAWFQIEPNLDFLVDYIFENFKKIK